MQTPAPPVYGIRRVHTPGSVGAVHFADLLDFRCMISGRGRKRGAEEWKSEVVWFCVTILQKPVADSLCAGGDDSKIRVAINEVHSPDFVQLVLVGILNDAQAVRPNVPESECVRDVDRVADSLREERSIDPGGVGRYVGFGSLVRLCFAPNVAEREICTVFALRRDQARVRGVSAVDETRGEVNGERRRNRSATLVSMRALVDERLREGESTRGSDV